MNESTNGYFNFEPIRKARKAFFAAQRAEQEAFAAWVEAKKQRHRAWNRFIATWDDAYETHQEEKKCLLATASTKWGPCGQNILAYKLGNYTLDICDRHLRTIENDWMPE